MRFQEKYDKVSTGALSGFLLPFIVAFFIFVFAKGDPSPGEWIRKIETANIVTHIISLAVFSNLAIFFLYNYLDMLRAVKGVLGVTIFWAAVVFLVKFLL
jgi:hypothetical protein